MVYIYSERIKRYTEAQDKETGQIVFGEIMK
jgi:hypothetical protein